VLSHAVRVGFAANHRRDYRAMCALLSPEIELHIYPDVPQLRALDIEPIYHGREGYVKATNLIKAEFENFRWELRELIDPGGTCFGARADIVAHGGLSGVEVRRTDFIVWQVEHGLARRQWELGSEAAMLTMLDRAQTRSS
jgi:hypothetical protein